MQTQVFNSVRTLQTESTTFKGLLTSGFRKFKNQWPTSNTNKTKHVGILVLCKFHSWKIQKEFQAILYKFNNFQSPKLFLFWSHTFTDIQVLLRTGLMVSKWNDSNDWTWFMCCNTLFPKQNNFHVGRRKMKRKTSGPERKIILLHLGFCFDHDEQCHLVLPKQTVCLQWLKHGLSIARKDDHRGFV